MSLTAIIPGWTALGFTKQEAVRHITSDHLRSHTARGKGNAAKRRQRDLEKRAEEAAALTTFCFTDEPLNERDWARMEAHYAKQRTARVLVATEATAEF